MAQQTEKKWWESSGFFIGVVTLIGSLWGMSEGDAASVVTAVTGGVATLALVWHKLKTSKFRGFSEWIADGNTWVYLAATVGAFLPNAEALFPSIKGLFDAFLSKDFGAIVSALVAAGVMAYNIFFKKK